MERNVGEDTLLSASQVCKHSETPESASVIVVHPPVVKPIGHWMLPTRKDEPACDLPQLHRAVRDETDQAARMKDWVRERMPVEHPDQCNQVLLEAARLFFPQVRRSESREPDSRRMWRLAKEAKSASAPDPVKQAQLEAASEAQRGRWPLKKPYKLNRKHPA